MVGACVKSPLKAILIAVGMNCPLFFFVVTGILELVRMACKFVACSFIGIRLYWYLNLNININNIQRRSNF